MIRRQSGFSLVEMLIAMVIAIIMVAAMYSFFTSQHRTYVVQDNVVDMQQNARMALLTLFRDVRMAGYGVPTSCALAPVNDTNGPDALFVSDSTVIQTLPDSQIFFAQLTADATAGDSSITLTTTDMDSNGSDDFAVSRALIISDETHTEGLTISSRNNNTFNLASALQHSYTADRARIVPAIFYGVVGGNLLQDNQTLAFNIEDLQIAYLDGDGTWYCHVTGASPPSDVPPTDIGSVRVMEIHVLARTNMADARDTSFSQPSIQDHVVADPQDGFRRRLLSTRVHVRNMGRL